MLGIITALKQYEKIKLIISYRTGYESLVLGDSVRDWLNTGKILSLIHEGFRDVSIDAVQDFLNHYGIPFSPEYKDRYKELYNDYYREMRETLNIKPYDYIQNDSFFDSGLKDVYILINGNDIIGSVALKGEEIDDLIVNSKYQGRGYGRQILLWALENINSKRIILRVAAWNKRAISLYEKNGFEIVGKA